MKNNNWRKRAILIAVFLAIFAHSALANGQIRMDLIRKIESNGVATAHRKTATDESWGLYQITRICLDDYNMFHVKHYQVQDLYDPNINTEIATWYLQVRIPQMLRYYKVEVTTENILIAYNAGIGNARKGRIPEITRRYLVKYKKLEGGK